MVLSLCSGLATYLILTGLTAHRADAPRRVSACSSSTWCWSLAMIVLIAWQVTRAVARPPPAGRGRPAACAHRQPVQRRSPLVPAILLADLRHAFRSTAASTIGSPNAPKSIIQNSIDVANAYLEEHGQVIRADTVGMARDIDEAVQLVRSQPQDFGSFLNAQAAMRALPIAYLIDGEGKVLATAAEVRKLPFRAPPTEAMALAKEGRR